MSVIDEVPSGSVCRRYPGRSPCVCCTHGSWERTLVDGTIAEREMRLSRTLPAAFAIDDVAAITIVRHY